LTQVHQTPPQRENSRSSGSGAAVLPGLDVLPTPRTCHVDVPSVMPTADRHGKLRQRLSDEGIRGLYKILKALALRRMLQQVVAGQG
jgi:hypothetical protein